MLRFLAISGVMLTCLLAPNGPRAVAVFQKPTAKSAPKTDAVVVEHCRIKFAERATLASGQMGILKSVLQKEGLPVEKNKPVATVDDSVQQAKIVVANEEAKNKIDILYAKKAAELARTEVEKAEAVNRDIEGTVPDIEVLKLKLAAERGALQVGLAEHEARIKMLQLKLAETELKTFVINAPFDGIVTKVFKHQGEAVRQGDPIVEIVNPTVIRAEGAVLLKDAWRVKRGDRVELELEQPFAKFIKTPDGKPVTFSGTVVFVDVDAEPFSGKVRVWANIENRQGILRSGLSATMKIHPGSAKTKKDKPSVTKP